MLRKRRVDDVGARGCRYVEVAVLGSSWKARCVKDQCRYRVYRVIVEMRKQRKRVRRRRGGGGGQEKEVEL
jgi:hypothetical protein